MADAPDESWGDGSLDSAELDRLASAAEAADELDDSSSPLKSSVRSAETYTEGSPSPALRRIGSQPVEESGDDDLNDRDRPSTAESYGASDARDDELDEDNEVTHGGRARSGGLSRGVSSASELGSPSRWASARGEDDGEDDYRGDENAEAADEDEREGRGEDGVLEADGVDGADEAERVDLAERARDDADEEAEEAEEVAAEEDEEDEEERMDDYADGSRGRGGDAAAAGLESQLSEMRALLTAMQAQQRKLAAQMRQAQREARDAQQEAAGARALASRLERERGAAADDERRACESASLPERGSPPGAREPSVPRTPDGQLRASGARSDGSASPPPPPAVGGAAEGEPPSAAADALPGAADGGMRETDAAPADAASEQPRSQQPTLSPRARAPAPAATTDALEGAEGARQGAAAGSPPRATRPPWRASILDEWRSYIDADTPSHARAAPPRPPLVALAVLEAGGQSSEARGRADEQWGARGGVDRASWAELEGTPLGGVGAQRPLPSAHVFGGHATPTAPPPAWQHTRPAAAWGAAAGPAGPRSARLLDEWVAYLETDDCAQASKLAPVMPTLVQRAVRSASAAHRPHGIHVPYACPSTGLLPTHDSGRYATPAGAAPGGFDFGCTGAQHMPVSVGQWSYPCSWTQPCGGGSTSASAVRPAAPPGPGPGCTQADFVS